MILNFEECALLVELESRPTLEALSKKLAKDASVISRDLKRMSEKAPVIEKINGRWVLTRTGQELSSWAKRILIEQSEILERDYTLTIATTREFASRILAINFDTFLKNPVRFNIMTCENGIEEAILKGQADFGFDCGKPQDPLITYKQIIEEQIVTVASNTFVKKNKIKKMDDLKTEDFLFYSRLSPLHCKDIDVKNAKVTSNDISVIRSLIKEDLGWATLPYYALAKEIQNNEFTIIRGGEIKGYKFGVWWLRGRESLMPWIQESQEWLSKQDLMEK